MACAVCLDTEIRKLKPAEVYNLGNILNIADSWKKLMSIVLKEGNIPKFNSDHISMIEQAAQKDKGNAAQLFLDEWSTMGKKRPTLGILLELLIKAQLFRAADYVACDILKHEKPKRPGYGPAAPIDVSDAAINKLLEKQQMLPQDTVDNSLVLGSTSEINKIYFCENTVNINEAVNKNTLDIAENSLNNKKSADITLHQTVSNLMKFSVTNICETVNKHSEYNIASASNNKFSPAEIRKETSNLEKSDMTAQYYNYEEVSSQELPVFLNNPEQSVAMLNEEMCSSDIPLCLKQ